MTDKALIEHILDDDSATDAELALADRLQAALAELDRMTFAAYRRLEATNGSHT